MPSEQRIKDDWSDLKACWGVNYSLAGRTPIAAADLWSNNHHGMAPAGAVAALGTAIMYCDDARKQRDAAIALLRRWHVMPNPIGEYGVNLENDTDEFLAKIQEGK